MQEIGQQQPIVNVVAERPGLLQVKLPAQIELRFERFLLSQDQPGRILTAVSAADLSAVDGLQPRSCQSSYVVAAATQQ